MDKSRLVYKLEGDSSIDANTLINVLLHNVAIVEEANRIVGGGVYDVNVKVNAINQGSFEIVLDLVSSVFEKLLKPENVAYIAALTEIISGTYKLYKIKKGKQVSNEEAKVITEIKVKGNKYVTINNITNVYNSVVVRKSIKNSLDTISKEEGVDGITITSDVEDAFVYDDGSPFTISNEEIEELSQVELENLPNEKTVTVDKAALSIITLSFEAGKTWEFIYDGNKIKCKIKDEELQKTIDAGLSFTKGDSLIAKLEIKQEFNEQYNAYVNKSYKVVEVIEHLPRPTQTKFDFDSTN